VKSFVFFVRRFSLPCILLSEPLLIFNQYLIKQVSIQMPAGEQLVQAVIWTIAVERRGKYPYQQLFGSIRKAR
jgi:hypothetical protein